MSRKITKIERKIGLTYKVDKDGYVIEEKYNILKDPWTLVTIVILILGTIYYIQVSSMKTNEAHFEDACIVYMKQRNIWISENPGEIPTLKEVMSVEIKDFSPNLGG